MGSPVSEEETEIQPIMKSGMSSLLCPLNALGPGSGSFKATCDVTNKINIDKYFELMREEFTTTTSPKSSRSTCRTLGRSVSSSKIEPLLSKNNTHELSPLSPRRKKNAKKRISCDEKSLAFFAAHNNMPRPESYFNYDLSGQMMTQESHHSENHYISRQKSWDLSKSKQKNWNKVKSESNKSTGEDHSYCDLSSSYSVGDFRDMKDSNNNDVVKSSKSCESLSSLGERHKEYAMMQGQIGSVSEENRRRRRKLFRKKGKKGSDEKPALISDDPDGGRINHLLEKKLVIDSG